MPVLPTLRRTTAGRIIRLTTNIGGLPPNCQLLRMTYGFACTAGPLSAHCSALHHPAGGLTRVCRFVAGSISISRPHYLPPAERRMGGYNTYTPPTLTPLPPPHWPTGVNGRYRIRRGIPQRLAPHRHSYRLPHPPPAPLPRLSPQPTTPYAAAPPIVSSGETTTRHLLARVSRITWYPLVDLHWHANDDGGQATQHHITLTTSPLIRF